MFELLRRTLRWRWPLIVAVFLPAALVAVVSVAGQAAPTTATTVVGVAPERTENATADLVALSLGRYAVELTSADTLDEVAEQTRTTPEELEDAIDVSVAPDAGTLTIRTDLPDERQAMFVASALAQVVVGFGEDDDFMDASVLSQPRSEPSGGLASGNVLAAALVLAALLVAVAIAYAAEVLRPRVRTGGDAALAVGGPVLGSLPPFSGGWPRRTSVGEAEVLKAARALRAGLASSAVDVAGGATCVIGTERGAGATTVSFLLARTAADRGESTVLLDLDLEEAGLSAKLDLALEPGSPSSPEESDPSGDSGAAGGLGAVLAERVALTDAVHHEGSVSIVGVVPDPSADELLDRRLPDVLKQAGDEWSLVLVDTGPLLAGELSEAVVAHATSAIVVVRLGSQVAHATRTARRLERLGVPVRGVVLNHAGRTVAEAPALSAALSGSEAPNEAGGRDG